MMREGRVLWLLHKEPAVRHNAADHSDEPGPRRQRMSSIEKTAAGLTTGLLLLALAGAAAAQQPVPKSS